MVELTPQNLNLALFVAGMLASIGHAVVTFSSSTWSKQTVVDTIIGGLGGLLIPSIPLVNELKPWTQVVVAAALCYSGSDLLINLGKQAAAAIPKLLAFLNK